MILIEIMIAMRNKLMNQKGLVEKQAVLVKIKKQVI